MFLLIGPDFINNYQSFVDLIDLDQNAISKLIEYKCFLDEWDNDRLSELTAEVTNVYLWGSQ